MSVCSSHADIDSKLMTVGLRCFYRRVAVGLVFDINFYTLIGMGIPLPRLQTRLSWVKRRKNADYRPINRYILEVIECGHIVTT